MINLYFSEADSRMINQQLEALEKFNHPYNLDNKLNFLVSYYYFRKENKNKIRKTKNHKYMNKIFLDSGAYSAFTQKNKINIDEYIKYINENIDVFDYVTQLDVIEDGEESLNNYLYMKDKIKDESKLLPVFQYGTDFKYYKELSKLNKSKIMGLGGVAGKSTQTRTNFFRNLIANNEGNKYHVFGFTAFGLVNKYQKYIKSIDSSRYSLTGAFGYIFIHNKGDVKAYPVSNKQLHNPKHILHNIDREKKLEIEKKMGVTFEELGSDVSLRRAFNIISFLEVMDYINNNNNKLRLRKSLI